LVPIVVSGREELSSPLDGCKRVAMAGKMRSPFRICGPEEYTVVANRIAPHCNRKSVANAGMVYGLKKLWRVCKMAHKSAAA